MSTQIRIQELTEFSSPVSQITSAATKELGAFLGAVSQVFGDAEVEPAADLWIARFESTDWIVGDKERTCRQVTIQALACLVKAKSATKTAISMKTSERHSRFEGSRASC